ncbi:MAG: response regulator [Nitrospirae bacterium]|nr:MAG: response regulator [Nitrospirota bacterium]
MGQSGIDRETKEFTCLVADDSEFARRTLARVVTTIGGNVVAEASNGQEAVDLFKKLKPDLVLLDVTMPVLDGVDTLRRILEVNGLARVIMVSAVGHREMIWKAICIGAKHYVTKPYSPDYAGMIIRSVLNGGGV